MTDTDIRTDPPLDGTLGDEWDTDALIGQIAAIYAKTGRQDAWNDEQETVRRCVEKLPAALRRYGNPVAIGVGGLGIVLKAEDRRLSGQPCAIKFPRPKVGSQELFSEMLSKEIVRLSTIRHAGVIRIHGAGEVTLSDASVPMPFYIMDFVAGNSSDEYLAANAPSHLTEVIALTADSIAALHSADLVHCDLKPENIMIDATGRPIITDLGTTKVFQPEDDAETRIGVTKQFAPRDVIEYLSVVSESDPDNYSGCIPRSRIQKQWDLVCFGKTLLVWLGYKLETGDPSRRTFEIDSYTRKYLLLMASRLLGSKDGYAWLQRHVNLPDRVIDEIRYDRIHDVITDIAKLSGTYSLEHEVPELDPHSPDIVQVGSSRPAALTPRVRQLIEHPSVRRLAAVTQLGIVNQVYLTATHSRFEHSLGTYSQACQLIRSLYNDPFSPFFRQVMTSADLRALLALAILHDTGQFPMAHDLEEISDDLFDHKRLTRAVLQGGRNPKVLGYQKFELASVAEALEQWDVPTNQLVALLDVKLERYGAGVKERLLHSIIDGPIDADKLDYLTRDSARLGIPYGNSIDESRISSSVTTIVTENDHRNLIVSIGVHEKARVAAEFLTIARSAMFSQAYWHHTVRAMKAMLTRAVQRIVVHIDGNDELRNRFVSGFESFVMSLPGSLSPLTQLALPEGTADRARDGAKAGTAENAGTLAATDAAVLIYLEEYMQSAGLKDGELLRDMRSRSLYKRLYVWSLGTDDKTGKDLANVWDKLGPRQKLSVYEALEARIANLVGVAADEHPETVTLTAASVDRVRLRVEGRLPLLLIDVPASRPGAEIPLYYVLEAERRALRKDGSAVGRARDSETWKEYAAQLQSKAGKLRIFCHEDAVDSVEAALSRDEFAQLFDDVCAGERT